MGDVINLNRARKLRERKQDKATAEANRASHGRTKAERQLSISEEARTDATLDGMKLEIDSTKSDDDNT